MTEDVVIVTSIAPVGIEKQKAAIDTWIALGFSVVSLNIQAEVDKLKSIFSNVKFHVVNRDGREKYGKPLVYIDDILSYLQEYGGKIGGIVNSDIHIRAEKDFASFILEQAEDSMVFASRVDIDSSESKSGETYAYGFDMFFFDQKLLKFFPTSDLCLGVPWWDYWVPLIALQKGLNTKYITNTVAYHIKHKINYSVQTWRKVGIWFADLFSPGMKTKLFEKLMSEQLESLDEDLGPHVTYNFIQMVYQTTNFITYEPKFINQSSNIEFDRSLEKSCELDRNLSSAFRKLKVDQPISYEECLGQAWLSYQKSDFREMADYLHQSLKYTCMQPTKIILNWVNEFVQLSREYDCQFDAYFLSDQPDWQKLIYSILISSD
ncbi:hypothetical protein H6F67_03870 [Microcoleus sp. FACHB-1515]|uniref:hypothetical protein n=1 Tax=Cyanophyceae TaxID=3028117 RepID=UPI001686A187|nr:hypothetical protein [Microcoleus sp. FACHB-1515]MBD2088990.1 hypothetical protein [Microcoleus sp. FACHB-1515]